MLIQAGQALPSSIEASQVLATVYTKDFSSSTPQDSSEDTSHPPDGDTTTPSTQPPNLRRDLSISTALDVPKRILLFYMCQLWVLHVVIKRQFLHL